MTLPVNLTPEELSRLTEEARAKGVTVDDLVRRVLREAETAASKNAPELPTWPGHVIGELRREGIYDDAR